MELETQRVWDYAGDGYVHRLIQNKSDGKLVELDAPTRGEVEGGERRYVGQEGGGGGGGVGADKMEAMGLEYSYLLMSQLESQRLWYESQLNQIGVESASQVSNLTVQLERLEVEHAAVVEERNRLLGEVEGLKKEKRTGEKKVERLVERLEGLEKEMREEREMNKGLRDNQDVWRKGIEDREKALKVKDEEVQELKEQVRDLMFYLETQQKVERSEMREDLQGGSVVGVAPAPAPAGPGRRRGRGKR